MNLEQEVQSIKERNQKVEIDKAWEVSVTRRIFIALLTYGIAYIWLVWIGEAQPGLKSFVPALGYILSTLSIPLIKKIWVKNQK